MLINAATKQQQAHQYSYQRGEQKTGTLIEVLLQYRGYVTPK
jgi:hypothetical protein